MPRIRLIEIDCGNIRPDQFDMTHTEKERLIEAGRDAGREALDPNGKGLKLLSQEGTQPSYNPQKYDDVAMKHGTELMRRFHQNMSKDIPTKVFVSYAHEDRELAEYIVRGNSATS